MNKIEVEIKERLGVLETFPNGWRMELNIVAWNGQPPKFDLREWSPDHERMSRGITLTQFQADALFEILQHNAFRLEDIHE